MASGRAAEGVARRHGGQNDLHRERTTAARASPPADRAHSGAWQLDAKGPGAACAPPESEVGLAPCADHLAVAKD
jgi:hypothetical protein